MSSCSFQWDLISEKRINLICFGFIGSNSIELGDGICKAESYEIAYVNKFPSQTNIQVSSRKLLL